MARIVRGGLIQCENPVNDESQPVHAIQKAALEAHLPFIEDAGKKGVQILCLQEIFNGPYFCPGQAVRWYEAAEPVPGPTTAIMQEYAKKYSMVIVVPVYEREQAGVYYNTAAVVGPGTSSAESYQRTAWPGQKYGPLKISCRHRIWTPFLPASSMKGMCAASAASLIAWTGFDSSLTGFSH